MRLAGRHGADNQPPAPGNPVLSWLWKAWRVKPVIHGAAVRFLLAALRWVSLEGLDPRGFAGCYAGDWAEPAWAN